MTTLLLAFMMLGAPGDLLERTWRMVNVEGSAPEIRFSSGAEPRVMGTTGCNRFSGTYKLEKGGRLTVGTVAVTRMACAAETMEVERRFLEALGRVNGFRIEDGELLLLEHGWELARFRVPKSR
jgi:heat shock protein HslJ